MKIEKEFTDTLGVKAWKKEPKIIYVPWISNYYWFGINICILKERTNLPSKWGVLAHIYTKQVNPDLFRHPFIKNPEKYFVSKIITEGIAEWISLDTALKSDVETQKLAQRRLQKGDFNDSRFLHKVIVIFSHDAADIISVRKKGLIPVFILLVKSIRRLEFSYKCLGYNYVNNLIKSGKTLQNIILNPPEHLSEIIDSSKTS